MGFLNAQTVIDAASDFTAGPRNFCLCFIFLAQDFLGCWVSPGGCAEDASLGPRDVALLLLAGTLILISAVATSSAAPVDGSCEQHKCWVILRYGRDFRALIKLSLPGHWGNACCLL